METTQLGKTEVKISAIGLGAMPLSIMGKPPENQAIEVIHRALDLGVTLIDTADAYCLDESDKHHNEKLIAKALQNYQGDVNNVIVATKGGLMRHQGQWTRDGNPAHLEQTIRLSFEALGSQKPIDLWQYHAPDPNYTIEESLTVVKAAVNEGIIRFVGVSNFSVEQIQRARDVVDIVSVQNQYNLWHRQPEVDSVLAYCQQEGLTFLPWSPFGGRHRFSNLQNIEPLVKLAKQKSVSVYCIILAWLRSKSSKIVPIPGATKISSIEDSVRAIDVDLSPTEIAVIERLNLS